MSDAARRILVVCAGNTCRSPMAAAVLARCLPGDDVASAGLAARDAAPASAHAVRLLAGRGIDLSGHRSRPLGAALVAGADLILTMEAAQARAILARWPEAAGRVAPFAAADIADPFGGSSEDYARTLAAIIAAAEVLADALAAGPAAITAGYRAADAASGADSGPFGRGRMPAATKPCAEPPAAIAKP